MSKIKICLDAGHVGSKYNQSPVVKTYYESAMNWKLHLKFKAELEARGFEVITTRADIDTDLGVYERGAASKGCNVFISIHSNACSTESVDYPVVYRAYDNLNDVDVLALQIAKKIGELMGTNQAGRTATRKNSAGGEYYGVLRGARAVGTPFYMLIEHSFHTNTAATKWLSVDANLDTPPSAQSSESPGRAFRSLSPLSARTQQPTASRRSSLRSSPTRARARAGSLPPLLSSGSISLRPSPRPRRAAAPRAPAILGAEAPPQAAASPKSMRPTCQRAVESLRQLMTPRQRQR